jgi:hypothetical protein
MNLPDFDNMETNYQNLIKILKENNNGKYITTKVSTPFIHGDPSKGDFFLHVFVTEILQLHNQCIKANRTITNIKFSEATSKGPNGTLMQDCTLELDPTVDSDDSGILHS